MRPQALCLASSLACTVLASPIVARADEEPGPTRAMSLREALDFAHVHQPDLRAALAHVTVAEGDATTTRARWYPLVVGTVQLDATTTNNTTGSYLSVAAFDNPRVSATRAESPSTASLVPSPSSLVGVGVRQQLFDFGRIAAQVAADEARVDMERASSSAIRLAIDYGIEEAYFAVHASRAILDAADKAHTRAVVHRDLAKAGVESGMRRPIELTRAETVTDRYELERIRGRRGLLRSQAIYAATVGVPERMLDVDARAPDVADEPPLASAFARAEEKNPELRAALARIRAQEKATRAIGSDARPVVYLTAAASGNAGGATPSSGESAPGRGLLPIVPNWDAGLVLAWPIFDATVGAREDRSRAAELEARERADSVRIAIAAAVERAYFDVRAAREALPVLRRAVDAAVANYDQANARFEVGLGNAVELADAEELRLQAEIELALGTFDLARTRAALGRAVAEGL